MKPVVSESIRALIEDVVRQHLDGHKIQPCAIEPAVDPDGSEWIDIDLRYEWSEKPIDPAQTLEMLRAVSDALAESGEYRTPYIENHFDQYQEIKDARRAS